MVKRKSPSELNTRLIRINVGSYMSLKEMAEKLGISMAEAFDQIWLTAFANSGKKKEV